MDVIPLPDLLVGGNRDINGNEYFYFGLEDGSVFDPPMMPITEPIPVPVGY